MVHACPSSFTRIHRSSSRAWTEYRRRAKCQRHVTSLVYGKKDGQCMCRRRSLSVLCFLTLHQKSNATGLCQISAPPLHHTFTQNICVCARLWSALKSKYPGVMQAIRKQRTKPHLTLRKFTGYNKCHQKNKQFTSQLTLPKTLVQKKRKEKAF